MISGADAHIDGEYLYQDFVLDNNGPGGNAEYPTDADTYHFNAADLLEVRAQPVSDGIAYRITLRTMTEPDVAAVAVGIDTDQNASTGTDQWGYGIGELGTLGMEHSSSPGGPVLNSTAIGSPRRTSPLTLSATG